MFESLHLLEFVATIAALLTRRDATRNWREGRIGVLSNVLCWGSIVAFAIGAGLRLIDGAAWHVGAAVACGMVLAVLTGVCELITPRRRCVLRTIAPGN